MADPLLTLRLNPSDNVVIAQCALLPGTAIAAESITVKGAVPAGHKIATRAIAKNEPIRRYGQIIGFASAPIEPGEHVHVQNCAMGEFERDYAYGTDARPTE